MENIILQQPQAFDLVDNTILISGIGVGFEGTLSVYIGDGHYEIEDYIQTGANSMKQFQAKVTIPDDIHFKLDKIYLMISDDSAGCEESECSTVLVPLIYAPNIIENYDGFWLHKVASGETLSKLAQKYYEDSKKWKIIYRSNIDRIVNPDLIHAGQILRIPREEGF